MMYYMNIKSLGLAFTQSFNVRLAATDKLALPEMLPMPVTTRSLV